MKLYNIIARIKYSQNFFSGIILVYQSLQEFFDSHIAPIGIFYVVSLIEN